MVLYNIYLLLTPKFTYSFSHNFIKHPLSIFITFSIFSLVSFTAELTIHDIVFWTGFVIETHTCWFWNTSHRTFSFRMHSMIGYNLVWRQQVAWFKRKIMIFIPYIVRSRSHYTYGDFYIVQPSQDGYKMGWLDALKKVA